AQPEHKQVVEVHHARGAFAFHVPLPDVFDLWRQSGEVVELLLKDLRDRSPGVESERKNIAEDIRLRKTRGLDVNVRLVYACSDQIFRILAVQNGEIPLVAHQVGVPPQNTVSHGVERAAPER